MMPEINNSDNISINIHIQNKNSGDGTKELSGTYCVKERIAHLKGI